MPDLKSITLYIARCLLICMAAGVVTSCVKDDDPSGESLVGRGDRLPDFSLTMADGTILTSLPPEEAPPGSRSIIGKRVLIELFNTDCPDCRESLPIVNEVYLSVKADPDVTVMAIARQESESQLRSYWEEHGLSLPYSPQDDRHIYDKFATSGIPRIYIADTSGIVTSIFGPDDSPTASTLLSLLH